MTLIDLIKRDGLRVTKHGDRWLVISEAGEFTVVELLYRSHTTKIVVNTFSEEVAVEELTKGNP